MRKCKALYDRNQDGSIFERLLVYSGLTVLCADISGMTDGSEAEYNHTLARSFSQYVLKTVDVMPAILPASYEGIEAVMTAVSDQSLLAGVQI